MVSSRLRIPIQSLTSRASAKLEAARDAGAALTKRDAMHAALIEMLEPHGEKFRPELHKRALNLAYKNRLWT